MLVYRSLSHFKVLTKKFVETNFCNLLLLTMFIVAPEFRLIYYESQRTQHESPAVTSGQSVS